MYHMSGILLNVILLLLLSHTGFSNTQLLNVFINCEDYDMLYMREKWHRYMYSSQIYGPVAVAGHTTSTLSVKWSSKARMIPSLIPAYPQKPTMKYGRA